VAEPIQRSPVKFAQAQTTRGRGPAGGRTILAPAPGGKTFPVAAEACRASTEGADAMQAQVSSDARTAR
jgi:hypothetical protein